MTRISIKLHYCFIAAIAAWIVIHICLLLFLLYCFQPLHDILVQGVVTVIRPLEPFMIEIKWNHGIRTSFSAKSSDQRMLQRELRRVILSKAKFFCFLITYQTIRAQLRQSRDHSKFLLIKNLDPGCKWFYRSYKSDYSLWYNFQG